MRLTDINEDEETEREATSVTRQEATNNKFLIRTREKKVFLQEKIFIPVNEYPNVSFLTSITYYKLFSCKILMKYSKF